MPARNGGSRGQEVALGSVSLEACSSAMIRVRLVGCERMGQGHLSLVRHVRGVQIAGVADTDLDRANRLSLPLEATMFSVNHR